MPVAATPVDTVVRPADTIEEGSVAAIVPARRRRTLIGGLVALGVVGLGITGTVVAATLSPPAPPLEATAPARPVDAEPAARPAQVSDLVGTAVDGGIRFTWTNPDPLDGDRYLWRAVVPGAQSTFEETAETSVVMAPDASGRTCIEVVLRRADGTSAATGAEGCAP